MKALRIAKPARPPATKTHVIFYDDLNGFRHFYGFSYSLGVRHAVKRTKVTSAKSRADRPGLKRGKHASRHWNKRLVDPMITPRCAGQHGVPS